VDPNLYLAVLVKAGAAGIAIGRWLIGPLRCGLSWQGWLGVVWLGQAWWVRCGSARLGRLGKV